MSDVLFAARMAVITFILVLLMQIRIGELPIEQHAHAWIQTAAPVLVLRDVAEGALRVGHDAWAKLTGGIKTKYWNKFDSSQLPGKRQLPFLMDRSDAYVEEQEEKIEALAQEKKRKKEKVEAELAARAQKVRRVIGIEEESDEPTPDDVDSQ